MTPTNRRGWLWIGGAVLLIVGIAIGLYAGWKVGYAIRDYEATKEIFALHDAIWEKAKEVEKLNQRMADMNALVSRMVGRAEGRLGLKEKPSKGN